MGARFNGEAERHSNMDVLIVEDHPLVAEAMRSALTACDKRIVSHVCTNADSAMGRLTEHGRQWHRIFLDLDVPGAYGLSLAKQVHQLGLSKRCCIVTALAKPELIAQAKAMGFLGYVIKAIPYAEFAKALASVLAGETSYPQTTQRVGQSAVRLTRRQEQLLDGVRRGLSSKEIASECFLSEGTVHNKINAAMKALRVTTRSQAVARAIELGFLVLDSRNYDRTPRP